MESEEETKTQTSDTNASILSAEEIQCWSSVKQDPADFQSWIKLLQFAEQKSQVTSAREAFEQFLQHYPFCYGYWKKFAEYEKKHSGVEEAKKVLERGLSAIPLSVDLWIHYLNFIIQYYKGRWDQTIRNAFEEAVDKCGLEAKSGRLWEAFIDWEKSHGNIDYVLELYDRLLVIPVIPCEVHFEKFQQFVNSHDPEQMLKPSELLQLKEGLEEEVQSNNTTKDIEENGISVVNKNLLSVLC